MSRITVFDVETPNSNNDRICSIGITLINDAVIQESFSVLVNPECEFDVFNVNLHGINANTVKNSPTFPQIWEKYGKLFNADAVVAHNAAFDTNVLRKVMFEYDIKCPPITLICTFRASKIIYPQLDSYKLNDLCNKFSLSLETHHDAGCDSLACAELFLLMAHENLLAIQNCANECCMDIAEYAPKRSAKSRPMGAGKSTGYKSSASTVNENIEELRGLLLGITCDDMLNNNEIHALHTWLDVNQNLMGTFPFDDIYTALKTVLQDGIISKDETNSLLELFKQVLNPVGNLSTDVSEINLTGKYFCLTGDFSCGARPKVVTMLEKGGGIYNSTLKRNTNYLIVGDEGSEKWSHNVYGDKVAKALELNKKGYDIKICGESAITALMEGLYV